MTIPARKFLERVVAWPGEGEPGFVNLHWKAAGRGYGMGGRAYRYIDDFMNMVEWASGRPPSQIGDIYYCLSTQALAEEVRRDDGFTFLKAKRHAHDALWLKAIWIDLDIKAKGYPTLTAALVALAKFIGAAGLPPPSALVSSGGGLHVYWISERPLTLAEWRPYAEGLKAQTLLLGLTCDAGVIADAARVLRVPNTVNCKTDPPRPVRLIGEMGPDYDFPTAFPALAATPVTATVTTRPASNIPPAMLAARPCAAFDDTDEDNLTKGLEYNSAPLSFNELTKNCPHFRDAKATGGAGYGQGLWMLDVLACTFMEDGLARAVEVSKGYGPAAQAETEAMYNRKLADREAHGLGWPSCHAFEGEGSRDCAACPFRGKVKSPLNLSVPKPPSPPPLPPPPPSGPGGFPPPRLPRGFCYDGDGIICAEVLKEDEDGKTDDEASFDPRPLFPGRILTVHCEVDNETRTGAIRMEVETFRDEKHGGKKTWTIVIPNSCLASEQLLTNAFCEQLFPPVYRQQRKYLVNFMRSFVQLVDEQKERQESEAFGWMFDPEKGERCGFAYGGKLYMEDGRTLPSSNTDPVLATHYMPRGQEKPWHDLMEIISAQKCPAREAIAAVGFAAPVFWIRGTHNMTLWAFSRGTAGFKSTSLYAALAVWGNPTMCKETRTVSPAGLTGKLGRLRSLPVAIDELQDQPQVELFAKHINSLSEGTTGSKSKRNGDMREKLDWQTLILACSNTSVREHYTSKHVSTDAGFMRVFEFEVPAGVATHKKGDVQRMMSSLDHNFGHIGEKYAAYIAVHWRAILANGLKVEEAFERDANVQEGHRFWAAVCISLIVGATLANLVTGKEYFHVPELYQFLVRWFKDQAAYVESNVTVAGSTANTEDLLGQFIKASHENQIWCSHMATGQRGRPTTPTVLGTYKVGGRNPVVHIRYNRDDRTIVLSKEAMMAFCDANNHDRGGMLAGLKNQFGATTLRVQLCHGLEQKYTQGRETCLKLDVPAGHFLEENLVAFNSVQPPELTVVPSTAAPTGATP